MASYFCCYVYKSEINLVQRPDGAPYVGALMCVLTVINDAHAAGFVLFRITENAEIFFHGGKTKMTAIAYIKDRAKYLVMILVYISMMYT